MSQTTYNIQSIVAQPDRGYAGEVIIDALKRVREETGLPGFGVVVVVLLFITQYVLSRVIGVAGNVIGSGSVGALASFVAVLYTGWVGISAHIEYSERDQARSISERPSIDTAEDAFRLLASADADARRFAANCIAESVSLGPSKVLTAVRTDPEEVVSYLIPFLNSEDEDVRADIARTISFFARDNPDAVAPYGSELLDFVEDADLSTDVRSELATSVGFLALSAVDMDTDRIEEKGLELAEHSEPQLRVAACYMLAGVGSTKAQEKIKEIAENDPDEEVRAHAGELY